MSKSILASTPFLILNKSLLVNYGIEANVVLSHLYQQQKYFKENNKLISGMFFCTTKNISCSTTLSYHQISKAIATLTNGGIIKVVRKGVPAKLHFQIDESQILKILKSSNEKSLIQDCENFYDKMLKDSTTINNNKEIRIKNNNNISPKDKFLNDLKTLEPKNFIEDFLDYWTEENSKGKMRWELEKTWNTSLRYKRWVRNNAKFEKSKSTDPNFPDYYDVHFAKRLEQDHTALRSYYKHLESLGYEKKVNSYDGKIKWIRR
ncbi:MAG: hypothetical protein Tp164SUR323001_35 [Prokaryotic dsDNA virus sp.]|nr:MAG: hypothetical protein Tp164SUR323001_35 [Prokaryotic dsDNA virus sp.]|tara:strand:+ start:1610 stop:2398 length:789 start_codon:yes stop_codon:yes gene_type:complete